MANREDLDDPFFQDAFDSDFDQPEIAPEKSTKHLDKQAKKQAKLESKKSKQQLESLFPEQDVDNKHFNAKDILKAEKLAKSKSKKLKSKLKNSSFELQDSYELDVGDQRFQALLKDHEFFIDPNNSQ